MLAGFPLIYSPITAGITLPSLPFFTHKKIQEQKAERAYVISNPLNFLNHVYIEPLCLVENSFHPKVGLNMTMKAKKVTNVKAEEKKREIEEPIYLLRS